MNSFIIQANQEQKITLTESGNYTIKLVGEGAHATINGIFKLEGRQTLDLNVTITHAAPHTSADTNLRAVVDDQAVATINGTIIVQKHAQQTNSFLTEKILLLSPQSHAHAIPNLEIEADDVKCSHAASISTIDEDQLFYLQSRGITRQQAISMLSEGFLGI